MPDESAFLRTIIDRPDDDGPRLVYADWLEEQGRAERAEFIRVQIRLTAPIGTIKNPKRHIEFSGGRWAETSHDCYGDKEDCEWCFSRRRERALLDADNCRNARAWFESDGFTVQLLDCRGEPSLHMVRSNGQVDQFGAILRRGFVGRVSLTLAAFVGETCQSCRDLAYMPMEDGGGGRICSRCNGTGRLPGLAAALAAACPLEGVVLTDKRPYDNGRRNSTRFFWWYSVPDHESAYAENRLPAEIFDLLTGHDAAWSPDESGNHGIRIRGYPSPAEAHAALSRACVAYARGLA